RTGTRPRPAGRPLQPPRPAPRARRAPAEREPRDERRDSLVGDDEVRAAAEDAEGEPATPRPRARVQEPGLVAHLDEVARRAADTERAVRPERDVLDRKSTRLNSSHQIISYAVLCLKKK